MRKYSIGVQLILAKNGLEKTAALRRILSCAADSTVDTYQYFGQLQYGSRKDAISKGQVIRSAAQIDFSFEVDLRSTLDGFEIDLRSSVVVRSI